MREIPLVPAAVDEFLQNDIVCTIRDLGWIIIVNSKTRLLALLVLPKSYLNNIKGLQRATPLSAVWSSCCTIRFVGSIEVHLAWIIRYIWYISERRNSYEYHQFRPFHLLTCSANKDIHQLRRSTQNTVLSAFVSIIKPLNTANKKNPIHSTQTMPLYPYPRLFCLHLPNHDPPRPFLSSPLHFHQQLLLTTSPTYKSLPYQPFESIHPFIHQSV